MSDGDQQPTPTNILDGLSFAPDWAKGSSDSHSTHLNKYAARFDADAERRRGDGRFPLHVAAHRVLPSESYG